MNPLISLPRKLCTNSIPEKQHIASGRGGFLTFCMGRLVSGLVMCLCRKFDCETHDFLSNLIFLREYQYSLGNHDIGQEVTLYQAKYALYTVSGVFEL